MFVTWLIVLIAGRMPRSLHEALAATVRYHIRVTGYFLMLTARYPGGLFGDPATSAFVAAPAGGAFPVGLADPAARSPGGPAGLGARSGQPGYGTPAGGAFDDGSPAPSGQPARTAPARRATASPPGYGQAAVRPGRHARSLARR